MSGARGGGEENWPRSALWCVRSRTGRRRAGKRSATTEPAAAARPQHSQASRRGACNRRRANADPRGRTKPRGLDTAIHPEASTRARGEEERYGELRGRRQQACSRSGSRSAAAGYQFAEAARARQWRAPLFAPPSSALSVLAATAAQRTATRGDCAPRPAFSSLA